MGRKTHWDKFYVLAKMQKDPDLTAREASRQFGINRNTIEKWCRENGISLAGHTAPRVSYVLANKTRRLARLRRELSVLEHEVKMLQKQDPNSAYRKVKMRRK
jgi:plasmid maintenance system antidote protein VapI